MGNNTAACSHQPALNIHGAGGFATVVYYWNHLTNDEVTFQSTVFLISKRIGSVSTFHIGHPMSRKWEGLKFVLFRRKLNDVTVVFGSKKFERMP
ncbi:hypothetical protein C0J52_16582 [Blattella germanica]|nr:hypothetical protein C0J52_16582 [Blattella germanica]